MKMFSLLMPQVAIAFALATYTGTAPLAGIDTIELDVEVIGDSLPPSQLYLPGGGPVIGGTAKKNAENTRLAAVLEAQIRGELQRSGLQVAGSQPGPELPPELSSDSTLPQMRVFVQVDHNYWHDGTFNFICKVEINLLDRVVVKRNGNSVTVPTWSFARSQIPSPGESVEARLLKGAEDALPRGTWAVMSSKMPTDRACSTGPEATPSYCRA